MTLAVRCIVYPQTAKKLTDTKSGLQFETVSLQWILCISLLSSVTTAPRKQVILMLTNAIPVNGL